MRLLLLEDDREFIEGLLADADLVAAGVECTVVGSAEDAMTEIAGGDFDLIVCDLEVPFRNGDRDKRLEYGRLVVAAAQSDTPGTPVLVLSGRGNLQMAVELLGRPLPQGVMYGGAKPMVMLGYVEKRNLPDFVDRLVEQAAELREVQAVGFASGGADLELTDAQRRLLASYTRLAGGQVAHVASLDEGLSTARVLRLHAKGPNHEHKSLVVARVASIAEIDDEEERYRSHIARPLGFGTHVTLTETIRVGAGRLGAHFYDLADGFAESLFDVLRADPASARALVATTARQLRPMSQGAEAQQAAVGAIRQLLLPADEVTEDIRRTLESLGSAEFEESVAWMRMCSQHCDLHGGNLLVRDREAVVMIDFANAAVAPAAIDPVTLELSLLFHPAAKDLGAPLLHLAPTWYQMEMDDAGPLGGFLEECRRWAFGVAAEDREVYACAYAFALRQLRFADTDHDAASALALAAMNAFNA